MKGLGFTLKKGVNLHSVITLNFASALWNLEQCGIAERKQKGEVERGVREGCIEGGDMGVSVDCGGLRRRREGYSIPNQYS